VTHRRRCSDVDDDPSLRITLTKDGRRRTFRIELSTRLDCWAIIDSDRATVRVVDGAAAARHTREAFDIAIRALLEDGWTPV
jgi:hypothetical protein